MNGGMVRDGGVPREGRGGARPPTGSPPAGAEGRGGARPPTGGRLPAAERFRILLGILPWLASRTRVPISEVAERTGLPEEEVVSLLELAACCGLPPYTPDQLLELIVGDGFIEAHLGPHLTRPRRLRPTEGLALLVAARAILRLRGADPDGSLARAVAKLEQALGIHQGLAVDLDDPPLLAAVREALEDAAPIEIDYYVASRDELTRRVVEPLAVFAEDGHWYLEAHCHLAGDVRRFRVDRVQRIVRAREAGGVPSPRAEPSGPRAFRPGAEARRVRLALERDARWLVESYPVEAVEELADGRLAVTLFVGGRSFLERLLLRLGPSGRVLDPPDLEGVGREAAERLLARYR